MAQIVLDGPSTLNALGVDTLTALESWLTSLDANQSIRAVILTGAGRAFCVGADLNRLGTDHERTMAAANSLIQAIRAMDVPLIAGSALFGIGWGISGFCPGGAIPALGLGETSAWAFVGSMLAGIFAAFTVRTAFAQRSLKNA